MEKYKSLFKEAYKKSGFYETKDEYVVVEDVAGEFYITTYLKKDVENIFYKTLKNKRKWMKEPISPIRTKVQKFNKILNQQLVRMGDYIQEDIILDFWMKNCPEYVVYVFASYLEEKDLYFFRIEDKKGNVSNSKEVSLW